MSKYVSFNATGVTARIIGREEWGARPPKEKTLVNPPVEYVIIHHSEKPSACTQVEDCKKKVKGIQNFHMDERKWSDIGYNFLIGGCGNVYEGRGWDVVGAHAPHYNNKSVGICFIGDYKSVEPTLVMKEAAQKLIEMAIDQGHLKQNYTLKGHRDVRSTSCPGDALYSTLDEYRNLG